MPGFIPHDEGIKIISRQLFRLYRWEIGKEVR